jgi:hypothetical protein
MIAILNAAAMECIRINIDYKSRNIFYIADEIANKRKLDANKILNQIAKLDVRYQGVIQMVRK